jgi:hypothetical protein
MSAAALAVAIVGIVLASISLSWQAFVFVLSGSRVRADLHHGARDASGVVSGLPGTQSLQSLAEQGFSVEVIGVEVFNVGRLAIQVTRVSAALANGVSVSALAGTIGPDLPYRLEAQSSASWFLPAEPIRRAVHASATISRGTDPCDVWGKVGLGNGKTVETRQRMPLTSQP